MGGVTDDTVAQPEARRAEGKRFSDEEFAPEAEAAGFDVGVAA
jgi:hypothetical protein